tara:strand:- start:194 stop:376 length:183 start_codon:yes stop_codon:yes gene_type:complete
MTDDETQKLLQLRQFLIDYYKTLEAPHSTTAVTQQKTVSPVISSAIKSIEDLVKDQVKFA